MRIYISLTLITCAFLASCAPDLPDGNIGGFRQGVAGDCFFLAAVMAIAQDEDGAKLLRESIQQTETGWEVTFDSNSNKPIAVTKAELKSYRLFNDLSGKRNARLAKGDGDVRLLEIAADKLWRTTKVKPEGLWHDVEMNAFYIFSRNPQLLIWNRKATSEEGQEDVDKYKRIPKGIVTEINTTDDLSTLKAIQDIVKSDSDGITMVKGDNFEMHSFTIAEIDIENGTYYFFDPHSGPEVTLQGSLNDLIDGVVFGRYTLNYIEI